MSRLAASLLAVAFGITAACTGSHGRDHKEPAEAPVAPADESSQSFRVGLSVQDLALTQSGLIAKVQLTCDGFAAGDPMQQVMDLPSGGTVTIYGNPTGCVLKLLQLTIDAAVYTPVAGKDFTTYAAGDQAVFSNGTEQIDVRVALQLPSPITADATVRYETLELAGETKIIEDLGTPSSDHQVLITGVAAPSLQVTHAALVALTPLTVGLRLDVECRSPLVVAATPEQSTCDGDTLESLKMVLVKKPADEPTLASMQDLFATTPATTVPLHEGYSFLAPGAVVPNGGFRLELLLSSLGFASIDELKATKALLAFGNAGGAFRYVVLAN
jgi:hypothetical protein